jgi:hypothetical protein
MKTVMELQSFYERIWKRYSEITPDSARIQSLLEARGEQVVNDHIAFRTFNIPGIDRFAIGGFFETWGYQKDPTDLDFTEKKLKASYWIHPDTKQPKIFVSELMLEQFSGDLQEWIRSVTAPLISRPKCFKPETFMEPSWNPISFEDYQHFYSISEYAAWTAAFGIQANHFTVLVNELKTIRSLEALNGILIERGFHLNSSGGLIKGTPDELLEQSSTQACKVDWPFAQGQTHQIMSCYYEFARRYPIPGSEKLFQGFLEKSADKIFESNFDNK